METIKLPDKWHITITDDNIDEINKLRELYGTFKHPIKIKDHGVVNNANNSILQGILRITGNLIYGTEITVEQFKYSVNHPNTTIPYIPEHWYLSGLNKEQQEIVGKFYESKLNITTYYIFSGNDLSSHNDQKISIFNATLNTGKSFFGAKGTQITFEQFLQLINNNNNKQNEDNNNNEVQRNVESIRSTTSGCAIRTQSRNCTISTTNGHVSNKISCKRSKATISSSNAKPNILSSSYN